MLLLSQFYEKVDSWGYTHKLCSVVIKGNPTCVMDVADVFDDAAEALE